MFMKIPDVEEGFVESQMPDVCVCGVVNYLKMYRFEDTYTQYADHKCVNCGRQITLSGSFVKDPPRSIKKCLICGRVMNENICVH